MNCNCAKKPSLPCIHLPNFKKSKFQGKRWQLCKTDTFANNCTKEEHVCWAYEEIP